MKEYFLEPIYDTRKSFYGKAKVVVEKNENKTYKKLYSYGTKVAEVLYVEYELFIPTKIEYRYFGKYSQTTSRHQKEFFLQEGLKLKELNELIKVGKIIR